MKIAKLLVLGAVLLISGKALAVDGNVWPKPEAPGVTQFVKYAENDTMYMYNVAAKMFFVGGNDYNTRASVGIKGYKVFFVQTDDGLELRDSVETQSAVKCTFSTEDAAAIWVDNSNETWRFWTVTENGDSYRISNAVSAAGLFLGWNGKAEDTRLYFVDPATAGVGVDWKFVSTATYAAYAEKVAEYEPKLDLYNEAMALKAVLDKAEEIGASVADQVAVYNNTASTKEELTAAITAANEAIAVREKELAQENITKATVANPVDVTALFIQNPTFTGNKYDGWSGDAFGGYNPQNNAEHYNKGYNTWQLLTEIPQGVYKFNVHAFYRAGDAAGAYKNYKEQNAISQYAKIFAASEGDSLTTSIASPFTAQLTEDMTTGTWSTATDDETGVVYHIPNNMVAADEFFGAGYCNDNAVYMAVGESGSMRVGVRKNETTGSDWSIFDDFSLVFLGNGADAYQLWLEEAMKGIKDIVVAEGAVYTESYLEAYNNARKVELKASTKAEVVAILAPINTAAADLDKNLKLWVEYQEVLEEAKTTAANMGLDQTYTEELGDWADFEGADALKDHALTNEELETIIADKRAAISEALAHPTTEQDMTKLLVNPDFEKGKEGWTQEAASGGNVATGGDGKNTCYEAWNNAGFDIYQVVQNAPKGVYEISVQGFYRYGRGNYSAYLNHDQYTTPETCPVFVYLNDNTTPFTNVYGDPQQITDASFYTTTDIETQTGDGGETLYFPNGMATSATAFSAGMYTQSAYGLVTEDGGQLRIGVKGVSNQAGDSWCIWDNFKLVWKGFNAEVILPVLQTNIEKAKEELNAPIGKDVAQKLSDAIKAGEDAIAKGDGQGMFDALSNIFAANSEVNASKTLFASLQVSFEDLANRLNEAICAVSVVQEAKALLAKVNDGIEQHTFADSEVEGLQLEIAQMMSRLGIPEDIDNATDESPIDVTTAVINANCLIQKGWEGSPAYDNNAQDAEKFNSDYNVYQRVYGLPAGVYTVSVNAFYRAGEAAADFDNYKADATKDNNSFLYAGTDKGDTVSVAIKRLASEAKELGDPIESGYVAVGETFMVPNNMTAAGAAFLEGLYAGNTVTVRLGEGDVLTIGLKKTEKITNDWTIWANWNLTYYGKNSQKDISENPMGISNVEMAETGSVVFYNLNGMRINKPVKGIVIMKQTLGDGTVKIKKVNLK